MRWAIKAAIADCLLTFMWIFCASSLGPVTLIISSVLGVAQGSSYTGPSMNPVNAFGWAYINNKHNTWEQLYVYWICPFVGAILAAWDFRFLFPLPTKQKKA